MPIKPSAFKALAQAQKRTKRNMTIKANLKTALKKTTKLMQENPKDEQLISLIRDVIKQADKAAQKGVYKPNKVARIKSRLLQKTDKAIKEQLFTAKQEKQA